LAVGLIRNYDRATQSTTLPLIGTVIELGEVEGAGRPGSGGNGDAGADAQGDDD